MNPTEIFLLVFLLYWLLVMFLDRRGILAKHNVTAYGPILMFRTTKGQGFLDRLAVHKRFWRTFANIGLPAMLIGMLAMFILIVFIDYMTIKSFQTQTVPLPGKFNEPRNIFLIPGVNEFIPLGYGIIALVITLVVHEFSHAILCKVEGIKVKSMGILLAMLPIGGFAEPDEDQLMGRKEEEGKAEKENLEPEEPKKLATRSERVRVLTAGVMANFVTALVAFVLFFSILGSLSPVGDVIITDVVPGYPADQAGVKPNMILTEINGNPINNASDFLFYAKTLKPGKNVTLSLIDSGQRKNIVVVPASSNETVEGVHVLSVEEGSPAALAGIKKDMILIKINDTEIRNGSDFMSFMLSTHKGQKIDAYLLSNNSRNASIETFKNIELAEKTTMDNQIGYLGIQFQFGEVIDSLGISVGEFPAKNLLNTLKTIPSAMNNLIGWSGLFILPFMIYGYNGSPVFSGLITYFYEPTGWAAYLGTNVFVILNVLMWVGWINFYVGLFNCLPAVPLDGGHVFRDVVASSLTRVMGNGEKVEKIANSIVVVFAVLILMSLVFVMIAPFAAHGF